MSFSPMNIYAKEGTKVIYMAENGRDYDVEEGNEHLVKGETYTVDNIDVHGWSSAVYLKEIPGIAFNTVMFKESEENVVDVEFKEV